MNITHETDVNGSMEKGKLIKNALLIVDALAQFDINEDEFDIDTLDELNKLIHKAKIMKRNRWWKLK